jgi:hypothetical protein
LARVHLSPKLLYRSAESNRNQSSITTQLSPILHTASLFPLFVLTFPCSARAHDCQTATLTSPPPISHSIRQLRSVATVILYRIQSILIAYLLLIGSSSAIVQARNQTVLSDCLSFHHRVPWLRRAYELRLQPCYLLQESDIPCIVWFEDAVRYYGVQVVLHALHVLVPDVNEAADVLMRKDWTSITPVPKKIENAFAHTAQHCLRPPKLKPNTKPLGPTTTILLPAMDWNWNCTLPEGREGSYSGDTDAMTFFFPPLPQLLVP